MDGRDDDTAELAQVLGLDERRTVLALGTGWRREREVSDAPFGRWFVTGEPAQVALGSVGFGFVLAKPAPTWDGVVRLRSNFEEVHRFQSEDVEFAPDVLAEAVERMRVRGAARSAGAGCAAPCTRRRASCAGAASAWTARAARSARSHSDYFVARRAGHA